MASQANATGAPLSPRGRGAGGEGEQRSRERRHRGFAKAMRRNPTEPERKMWLLLKDRRFVGHKFRRQVPIGPYIADFVCYSNRLIIELDGARHGNAHDAARDRWFAAKNFRVLRFWNGELTDNPAGVCDAIWAQLEDAHA